MDSSKLKVVLSSVPNYPLKLVREEIVNALNGNVHAVTKVKRCKDANGEIIPGKMEVELQSIDGEKFYQQLLPYRLRFAKNFRRAIMFYVQWFETAHLFSPLLLCNICAAQP